MSFQTWFQGVEAKIKTWAGEAEDFVEEEAEAGWKAAGSVLTSIATDSWSKLVTGAQGLVSAEEKGTTSLDSFGSSLLNVAENVGVTELKALPQEMFQAVAAAIFAVI